jgi:RNA polymerase primary sigma factor
LAKHTKRTASARSAPKKASPPKAGKGSNGSKPSPAAAAGRKAAKPPKPAVTKTAARDDEVEASPEESIASALGAATAGDTQARIRELIKLAKEQGYLTFDDLNEALPADVTDADELDAILTRLRRMEINIIEASEVDSYKDGKKDEEEEEEKPETKLDILDDPVRMYLKQMGQVPLLTREQEVEISKRIEEAENMVQRLINRFGFIAQAHLDLAEKLTEGGERFDRVILDKKIESRERYMKMLPGLCKQVAKLSSTIETQYAQMLAGSRVDPKKLKAFQKSVASLQKLYPKFYFKQKVTEEFVNLADEKFLQLTNLQAELTKHPRDHAARLPLGAKSRELETMLWLSLEEYTSSIRS